MNIALPYQDLTIMDACLECGVGQNQPAFIRYDLEAVYVIESR
jgi:hypothetical protein